MGDFRRLLVILTSLNVDKGKLGSFGRISFCFGALKGARGVPWSQIGDILHPDTDKVGWDGKNVSEDEKKYIDKMQNRKIKKRIKKIKIK